MLTYVFAGLWVWSISNIRKFYDAGDEKNLKKWKTINTVCIVGEWLCTILVIGMLSG